jgi:indole-3-glycerol phosphate synthase
MADHLDLLARTAKETVEKGYYQHDEPKKKRTLSLRSSIVECSENPVITEIKYASPSQGPLGRRLNPTELALTMESNGAAAISLLTEPQHFQGELRNLPKIREKVTLPILMKDIIIGEEQVSAAANYGADAVLLIKTLFDREYCEYPLETMIDIAHEHGLEVLLETHSPKEYKHSMNSQADLIGINNRDLQTLEVDINVTKSILETNGTRGRMIVSESGIKTPEDLLYLKSYGANAYLIGSAIIQSKDPGKTIRRFVKA